MPALLACAVSARLRDLCEYKGSTNFTAYDLISESQEAFEKKYLWGNGDFHIILGYFTKWLYSIDIWPSRVQAHGLWYFGQKIGAPAFQNDALKTTCSHLITNAFRSDDEYYLDDIANCWKAVDFAQDEAHDCYIGEGDVYWENKKFLNFVFDYLVDQRIEEEEVQDIIRLD